MPKITGEPKHPRANRLYNAEWEALPEFRGWLGQSTDEEKGARCKLCHKDLRCHLFDIKKHSETKKHRDLAGDIPEEAYEALPRRQSIPVAIPGMKRKILKMSKSNRKIKKPKKYEDNGYVHICSITIGYNILRVSINLNTKEIAIGNFNHGTSEV